MRRSQVSIFVALGLVILIALGIIIILNDIAIQSQTNPTSAITNVPRVFPIERYVEYCVETELEPLIDQLASQGGQLNITENTINDNGQRFLIHYTPALGNIVLSRSKVEQDIASFSIPALDSCIDTDVYVQLGYAVKDANKTLNVTITDKEIILRLNYPIKLTKDKQIISKADFVSTVQKPLGKMLDDARDIVNAELNKGTFDLDYYRSNSNYKIYKRKPHPYTTYRIQHPSLTFNFGIEKPDIVIQKFSNPELLYKTPLQESEGTCIESKKCFSHAKETNCFGDYYIGESACQIENQIMETQFLTEGLPCISWFDVYSGTYVTNQTKQNGESWCSQEQGAGGRHYKLSCTDGQVLVEQCADYKEEICGMEIIDNKTFSSCRPNRFWSCTNCNSESCCSDSSRDCTWDKDLGCYPTTEPGLKFWNLEKATQICSNAVMPNSIPAEESEFICFSTGDCGSKPNYYGDFSNYLNPLYYTKLYKQQLNTPVKRDISNYNNPLLINQETTSSYNFIQTLNNYIINIEEIMMYDIEDYLSPDFNIDIEDSETTQCLPWTPTGSNCNSCNSIIGLNGNSDYSECTEYKCRSLGNDCMFEVKNGIPVCRALQGDGSTLEIKNVTLDYQSSAETSSLGKGLKISEDVALFKPFNLKFETSEEALCKISFLPRRDFDEISTRDLSAHEFTTNHSVSFSLTHDFEVFENILDYFNVNSFSETLESLVELRYQMEAFAANNPGNNKYTSGIYSILVPIADYYTNEITQPLLITLFDELDAGNYHMFIVCQDRNGNQNGDRYIEFSLQDTCEDEAPQILHSKDELTIYLNEISECRYNIEEKPYDEMTKDFMCEKNPYRISGIANGSYKCTANVQENVYVACKDHPEFAEKGKQWFFEKGTTTLNTSTNNLSLVINAENLEEGNYTIGTENKKYTELIFNRPFECTDMQCSASKCTGKSFVNTTCKRKIDICPSYIQNENVTYIEINQTPKMRINSTYLENDIAYAVINNSNDVYCGIMLNEDQGYLQMSKNNNTYSYRISSYSNSDNITILCYNNNEIETIPLTP